MIVKKRIKVIPKKEEIVDVYVSEDGTEFDKESSCRVYEAEKRSSKMYVIHDVPAIDDYTRGELYYIKDEKDIQDLKWLKKAGNYLYNDFNEHGKGWYFYYSDVLVHYESYVNETRQRFIRIVSENKDKINSFNDLIGEDK